MLTERQIRILNLIIKDFIDTGLPVGSRTISKKAKIKVSPATIRNEMADLEELGYIIQPHVSAGRIPSEMGLRFYVDNLHELAFPKGESVLSGFNFSKKDSNRLLTEAAKLLSDMTGLLAIVTEPKFSFRRISNLKFVKISDKKVLFVIVTDNEVVKTFTLDGVAIEQSDLDNISDIILKEFYMCSVDEITLKRVSKLSYYYPKYDLFFEYFIPFIRKCIDEFSKENVYIYGKDELFKGNNVNVDSVVKTIDYLKNSDDVLELLNSEVDSTQVRIGREIGVEEFNNYSIVQGSYEFSSGRTARVAVIGPLRMDYENVMNIVDAFSKSLSSIYMGIHL